MREKQKKGNIRAAYQLPEATQLKKQTREMKQKNKQEVKERSDLLMGPSLVWLFRFISTFFIILLRNQSYVAGNYLIMDSANRFGLKDKQCQMIINQIQMNFTMMIKMENMLDCNRIHHCVLTPVNNVYILMSKL